LLNSPLIFTNSDLLGKALHIKIHFLFAMLIAFFLPMGVLTPIFIALMLLNWILEGDFKDKFQRILKNKFALLFIGFYLLHLFGLIYTSNIPSGLFDVQVKLSLFIFPLIIASSPYNSEQRTKIFYALIAGALLASIVMLSKAFYTYYTTGENHFFYQDFSFLVHPSYLSMYLAVIIAFLIIAIFNNSFNKKFALALILFFTVINFLLSSKLGLISNFLLLFGSLVYYIIKFRKIIFGVISILLVAISFLLVFKYIPSIGERIHWALVAVKGSDKVNKGETESSAVRILVWKATRNIISKNLLLGVGTGDAKDALMEEYQKEVLTGAYEHKLNAHNEYLQVFVALGLIGFLVFMSSLIGPLIHAFKYSNALYFLFLLIIMLSFVTESMLETQAGVMFYAFFNSVLCFNSITINHQEKK
jgi:O-antigen ligase